VAVRVFSPTIDGHPGELFARTACFLRFVAAIFRHPPGSTGSDGEEAKTMETKTLVRSVALTGMIVASALFAAQALLLPAPDRPDRGALQVAALAPDTPPIRPRLPDAVDAGAIDVRLPSPQPMPAPSAPPSPPLAAAPIPVAPEGLEPAQSPLGLPCGLSVVASALPGGLAAVDIMDPCQPDARIDVRHAGLTVADRTDALGLLSLDLPAFESPARITVTAANGQAVHAEVEIADLDAYTRFAIAWEHDRGLALHAMAPEASFGGDGHIWSEAPGALPDLLAGRGGFLIALGDASLSDPRLAQVLTYPRALFDTASRPRISVDAPITAATCGQRIVAQGMETRVGAPPVTTPVTLTLPGCEAAGGYILLQNLFQGLRLATN
jgi:hypothetical protein